MRDILKDLLKDPKEALDNLTIPQMQSVLEQLKALRGTSTAWSKIPDDVGTFASALSKGVWYGAKHLEILSKWLQDLEAGRRSRILVSMPPRHGKSELISYWFPLWLLARNPERKIILASYEAEFAAHWGRRVRDAITTYGPDLGLELRGDSTAAHRWDLTKGGGMFTAGAGGPMSGRGAHALIIDDPIKNAEEANSEVMREGLWDWFQTVAMSRLEPGGFIVIVGTRWHQDDLIGRIEAQMRRPDGVPWDVIKFPALAEAEDPLGRVPGEALWPERYNAIALDSIRRTYTAYNWSALYQQRPSPEEGGGVKRRWWNYFEVPPAEFDSVIQSWDLAFKDLTSSDYTVGQVWGRKGAQFYLLHQVRERMNMPEVIAAARNMTRLYPRALAKLIEDKANGPAVIQTLQKEIAGIIPWPPKGKAMASKDSRLEAVIPMIEAGNCFLPGKRKSDGTYEPMAHWVSEFVEECAQFPNGTNDDQLDAMVHALTYMQPQAWRSVDRDYDAATSTEPAGSVQEIYKRRWEGELQKVYKRTEARVNALSPIFQSKGGRRW